LETEFLLEQIQSNTILRAIYTFLTLNISTFYVKLKAKT